MTQLSHHSPKRRKASSHLALENKYFNFSAALALCSSFISTCDIGKISIHLHTVTQLFNKHTFGRLKNIQLMVVLSYDTIKSSVIHRSQDSSLKLV